MCGLAGRSRRGQGQEQARWQLASGKESWLAGEGEGGKGFKVRVAKPKANVVSLCVACVVLSMQACVAHTHTHPKLTHTQSHTHTQRGSKIFTVIFTTLKIVLNVNAAAACWRNKKRRPERGVSSERARASKWECAHIIETPLHAHTHSLTRTCTQLSSAVRTCVKLCALSFFFCFFLLHFAAAHFGLF